MSSLKITAAEASKNKEAKKQIADQLKQFGKISWEYSYCTKCTMVSFGDLVAQTEKPRPTAQERLDQFVENTSVCLVGKVGRKSRTVEISGVPDCISQHQKYFYDQDEAEQAEFEAKTPAEQNEEINKLLDLLTAADNPGFFAINVPRR